MIAAALPADPQSPGSRAAFAALLPHAQAALGEDSGSIWKIVSYLGYSGNYPAARDLQQRVLQAQARVSGPEHRDTLSARANLARWTGQAGDPAGARDQFAALVPVDERVLGPEHRVTLGARANLAFWTGRAGDPAGARDQYAALLPVDERILGPDHPHTLTARANLAYYTGGGGGCRRGPRPACGAAADGRADPWPRTPGNAARPRPVRPLDRGKRGTRRRLATSLRRCCR